MKVLAPALSVMLTSHCKPRWLEEAICSVLGQTRRDLELVVADSGQWIGRDDGTSAEMQRVHAAYAGHPLVVWVTTGERPALQHRVCPAAWAQNQVIRAGLLRGRYFTLFYDDDLYLPEFAEQMAGFLDANPAAQAVWCSQEQKRQEGDGFVSEAFRMAMVPKQAGLFDCQVDGGQVMMRTSLLTLVGDPWVPEEPGAGSCSHIDGLFFERMAVHAGVVPPLPDQGVLCVNRRTTLSVNRPVRG